MRFFAVLSYEIKDDSAAELKRLDVKEPKGKHKLLIHQFQVSSFISLHQQRQTLISLAAAGDSNSIFGPVLYDNEMSLFDDDNDVTSLEQPTKLPYQMFYADYYLLLSLPFGLSWQT